MIKHVVKDPNGQDCGIEIDPDLLWIIPYLTVAKRKGIPIWRLRKIKGYIVPEGKAEGQCAQIFLHSSGKKYIITLLKSKQVLSGDGRRLRVVNYQNAEDAVAFEDTLLTVAHELAHLVEWDHTAAHLIQTARLFLAFARQAKIKGYTGYKD